MTTDRRTHDLKKSARRGLAMALAGLAANVSVVALAGPVTYEGTLGDDRIIVEFTEDPYQAEDAFDARFALMSDGVDIPLHFGRWGRDLIILNQEAICIREECAEGTAPPIDAIWHLDIKAQSGPINARWEQNGTILPIQLHLIGERTRAPHEQRTAAGLVGYTEYGVLSEEIIDPLTHPYEHAKMNSPLETIGETEFKGSAVSYVVDPRTRFPAPRVVRFADGASPDRVNALLAQFHWRKSLSALNCKSARYGTVRQQQMGGPTPEQGSLGGYDTITVKVTQLTPSVLSYVESGSLSCGGGSPDNFTTPVIIDAKRAEIVEVSELFDDWTADGPGPSLVAFVRSRTPQREWSLDGGHICSFDQFAGSYLSAYPVAMENGKPGVTFGIYGLPTVIAACSRDLVTIPLDELDDYLSTMAGELLGD